MMDLRESKNYESVSEGLTVSASIGKAPPKGDEMKRGEGTSNQGKTSFSWVVLVFLIWLATRGIENSGASWMTCLLSFI